MKFALIISKEMREKNKTRISFSNFIINLILLFYLEYFFMDRIQLIEFQTINLIFGFQTISLSSYTLINDPKKLNTFFEVHSFKGFTHDMIVFFF